MGNNNTSEKAPVKADEEKKSDTAAEEKKDEAPKEEKSEKAEEKASDDKQTDDKAENTPPKTEDAPETKEEKVSDVPQMSETDKLKAENLTLKTQLEALKIGFKSDCMEDAVILAENIVKRGDMEISEALQAVAKKYPDWKSDSKNEKSKGGFRIGADSSDDNNKIDEDRMREAFGIRKKK